MAPAPRSHHAPRRLLADEEAGEGGDGERLGDIVGDEVEEGAAGAEAGIEQHDVEGAERAIDLGKQGLDGVGLGGVGGDQDGADLLGEGGELVGVAGGERDLVAVAVRARGRRRR